MKSYYNLLMTAAIIGCVQGAGNKTAEWSTPLKCIKEPGPDISTELPGLSPSSGHSYKIDVGELNVLVRLSKDPIPKEEWKLTKKTYQVAGTGADFGVGGLPGSGESKDPLVIIGFDYKPEDKGKEKSCTLFSQVKIYGYEFRMKNGKEEKTGTTGVDSGVSGKDTDPTVTIKY